MDTGDLAPDFTLNDQDGQPRSLYALLNDGPVVLFFYPQAHTSGCTKEACHFRDVGAAFREAGAQRIGISMDRVDAQSSFATKHALDYPLLSDPKGVVARTYGVKRAIDLLKVKRTTFVIGTDHVIKARIASEFDMNRHADLALAALAQS